MENYFATNYIQNDLWLNQNGKVICPIVIAKEGILHGSRGAIFYRSEVLKKYAPKFNNIPLTLNHPIFENEFVSVNYNEQIQKKYIIGKVSDAFYNHAKKAICGFIEICENHELLDFIKTLKEVSMGVFTDEIIEQGTFWGKSYEKTCTYIKPDHVAILAGQTGACSFADGCGLRKLHEAEQPLFPEAEQPLFPVEFLDDENEENQNKETSNYFIF